MSLHKNTVPQVLCNTPDPHSHPSELYKINGTVLATATDPVKCWVIHEEHGVWDEATKTFENRCASPKFCAHRKKRDSLPRRLSHPGYPFTFKRRQSLPGAPEP